VLFWGVKDHLYMKVYHFPIDLAMLEKTSKIVTTKGLAQTARQKIHP
jgi:hypothetical protein